MKVLSQQLPLDNGTDLNLQIDVEEGHGTLSVSLPDFVDIGIETVYRMNFQIPRE